MQSIIQFFSLIVVVVASGDEPLCPTEHKAHDVKIIDIKGDWYVYNVEGNVEKPGRTFNIKPIGPSENPSEFEISGHTTVKGTKHERSSKGIISTKGKATIITPAIKNDKYAVIHQISDYKKDVYMTLWMCGPYKKFIELENQFTVLTRKKTLEEEMQKTVKNNLKEFQDVVRKAQRSSQL